MGTRSLIGILNKDGSIKLKYCHWDGYYSGAGQNLFEHYNNEAMARELVRLGDMSALCERIAPDPEKPHSFEEPQPGVSIFYGRDRNEAGCEPSTFEDLHAVEFNRGFEAYMYLWSDHLGEWIACQTGKEVAVDFVWHRLADIAAANYEWDEIDATVLADRPDNWTEFDYDEAFVSGFTAPLSLVPVELF